VNALLGPRGVDIPSPSDRATQVPDEQEQRVQRNDGFVDAPGVVVEWPDRDPGEAMILWSSVSTSSATPTPAPGGTTRHHYSDAVEA
jgi:hypothetical protein